MREGGREGGGSLLIVCQNSRGSMSMARDGGR